MLWQGAGDFISWTIDGNKIIDARVLLGYIVFSKYHKTDTVCFNNNCSHISLRQALSDKSCQTIS